MGRIVAPPDHWCCFTEPSHGSTPTSGSSFPISRRRRKVIAVEQQAHGHTADIDRSLTYEQMADDTAELLRQLKIDDADFFCYSMGGAIATQIAIRHPELVHKLVFAGGTSYNPSGYYRS